MRAVFLIPSPLQLPEKNFRIRGQIRKKSCIIVVMKNRHSENRCLVSFPGEGVFHLMVLTGAYLAFDKISNGAKPYIASGEAHHVSGRSDRAIADYTKAIGLDPQSARAYKLRGIAYLSEDRYDQAISDFNKAIQLDSQCFETYCNRGIAYSVNDKHDLAFADFNKAINLNPLYADAYNGRGSAYNRKGEHDCALTDYNKAIELDPQGSDGYNNRGILYSIKFEYDLAIADLSKAIELNPQRSTYYNRGNVYKSKGEIDRAAADYNKAIELDSQGYIYYHNLGKAYRAKYRGHDLGNAGGNASKLTDEAGAATLKEEFKNVPFHIRLMGGFRGSRVIYNRYVKNYNKMVSIISTAVAEGDITVEEGRFVLSQCRK